MMALSAPIDLNYSKLNYTAMKHFNLLKTLLLLCALIVGSLSGWADTVTLSSAQIKSGSGSSSYGACSATDGDGNTWSAYAIKNQHSKATSDYNYWQIKKYASNTAYYIQVPTLGSKITSISLVVSGSSQPRDNGGNSATLYFSNSNSTSTTGVGVVSGTGANSVTLDCSSLNLNSGYITASGAVRIWDIEVTYNPAGPVDARADAGISFAEADIEKTWGESFTGQSLSNPNSVDVTYSSTEESVATVSSTGVVTMLKAGSTTIKATFAGDATYKAAVASYDLTINKANANLSFDETVFDVDLNDNSFVAPTLNNPNHLTVTYISDNEELASVDNTGEVSLVTTAEGTVTITASFAGNDNYNPGNASYTITVTDPNRKGTKKNPYTVAEIIDGTATGNDVYAVGYIVGCYNAGNKSNFGRNGATDTNLAIAEDPNESAVANTVAVQLPNNSIRTNFKLTNHTYYIGVTKILIKADITSYITTKGLKSTKEVSAISEVVAVSNAGFATYASDFGLDFSGLDVKAYKARVKGTTITFDKVTEVPAGEGVLLQGEGTFEVPVKSVDAWAADDNAFVRGTGAAVATGDGPYNYILNKVNGVVGFYKANDQTVAKNRAYLQSTTAAARISLNFDEETTGISEVVKSDVNNKVYDLQGRHIAQPTKGLYIMNGRKVLVK